MSYHIVHVDTPKTYLHIEDSWLTTDPGGRVPLEDVAVVVVTAKDFVVTGQTLWRA